MHDGPGGSGLSRKAIMEQIDASIRTHRIDIQVNGRILAGTGVELVAR